MDISWALACPLGPLDIWFSTMLAAAKVSECRIEKWMDNVNRLDVVMFSY